MVNCCLNFFLKIKAFLFKKLKILFCADCNAEKHVEFRNSLIEFVFKRCLQPKQSVVNQAPSNHNLYKSWK